MSESPTKIVAVSPLAFLEGAQEMMVDYAKELFEKYETPEDVPYEETAKFSENTLPFWPFKRARSFRADMMHKLGVILRAYGTQREAAYALKIESYVFGRWMSMKAAPAGRAVYDRLDRTYEMALVRLEMAHNKKQAKKK